jgi:hypothetical protein
MNIFHNREQQSPLAHILDFICEPTTEPSATRGVTIAEVFLPS